MSPIFTLGYVGMRLHDGADFGAVLKIAADFASN
jgi:hypothetical protein